MSENLIAELVKRLNAKTIHELRQLGRALGVPHPADGKKEMLIGEIISVASGEDVQTQHSKRGAPPKSQEYDRQLAADILMCREIFLTKNLPKDEFTPKELFVASGDVNSLDYIGGGILEYDGETWFLRTTGCKENIVADVFVNPYFINTYKLREGDYVEGRCKRASLDEMAGLASVLKINELHPNTSRLEFDSLSPIYANKKLNISCGRNDKTGRIIDLLAPIGAGQRVFVVSPHGCGNTRIIKDIAKGIESNNRNVKLVMVLIDVSPEDAADFTKSFRTADVFTSSFDAGVAAHIRTMRLALEYCKRQVEMSKNVVIFVDDMTRLVRAYNSYGKATSGLDYSAVDCAKKILAAAKNTEQGGSLTFVSALSLSDDVIENGAYSALKDICNAKITLSQTLARRRIYPPIDFAETFSTADTRLLSERELQASVKLRGKQVEEVFTLLDETQNSAQLIEKILR